MPSLMVLNPTKSWSTTFEPTVTDTASVIMRVAWLPSIVGIKPLVSFSVTLIFAWCGFSSFTLLAASVKSRGISIPK